MNLIDPEGLVWHIVGGAAGGAAGGAIIGAIVGGAKAAAMGNDITTGALHGAAFGAAIGGVTGGVLMATGAPLYGWGGSYLFTGSSDAFIAGFNTAFYGSKLPGFFTTLFTAFFGKPPEAYGDVIDVISVQCE